MSFIERIGQSIKGIEANYEQFDRSAFNDGGIVEYTVTVHKKLLKEAIGLFKATAEYSDLFIHEFSPNEMNLIAGLAESLASSPYNGSILNTDGYKPLISRMRVIFGEKRALQYKSEVDKMQELIVRVEDMLKKEKRVSSMQESIDDIHAKLSNITDSQNQAKAGLEEVQNKNAEVVSVLGNANTKYKEIEEKRSAIVAFFGEIVRNQKDLKELETENTKFVQKLKADDTEYKEKREGNLQELETQNAEFSEKLKKDDTEYSEKRDEVLKTAEGMLGLSNAGGLADAFNQRIEKAKEKWRFPWILGAIFFITAAMGAGWFYDQGADITLTGTLARISITAIPLLGAWFCAAQYLRLERTSEDYQYKKALAQSMPAFMKQLGESNEDYRHAYLSLALQQMLQDPLRKQHDVPSPFKDLFEMIKKSSKDT